MERGKFRASANAPGRTFCFPLSLRFSFLLFLVSLLSSTMQSSLLLRARAPVSSSRSAAAPKRGAAVKPLAATAVPTEVNLSSYFFKWFPETGNRRNRLECARVPGLLGMH